MAGGLRDAWWDALRAGFRYYGVMGRLALEGFEWWLPEGTNLLRAGSPPSNRTQGPGPEALPAPASSALVLEAGSGERARGLFLVENPLPAEVGGRVESTGFVDPRGIPARVEVAFQPPELHLRSGEQALVQVSAAIDDGLEPGVRYTGEVGVPGLSQARIPIVLRRRVADATTS